MFLGIIILAIGVVFILKAMGFLSASSWTLFWGIVFLAVGLKLIIKRHHCLHCAWFGHQYHSKEHGE